LPLRLRGHEPLVRQHERRRYARRRYARRRRAWGRPAPLTRFRQRRNIMRTSLLLLAALAIHPTPNMPTRNRWLAEGVSPVSRSDADSDSDFAAAESVARGGPTQGRPLTVADVTIVPNLYTSSATVKTEGHSTIVIASGIDGIRKID